jgi:hypothetical protein
MKVRIAALAVLGLFALGGCSPIRFKGIEAHDAAFTPNPPGPGKGDPYANGGTAMASGGTHPLASEASTKPKIGSL